MRNTFDSRIITRMKVESRDATIISRAMDDQEATVNAWKKEL